MKRSAAICGAFALVLLAAIPSAAGGGGGHGKICTDPRSGTGTTMFMKDFCYDPTVLHIAAGTTVRFINYDQAPHTVTSEDGRTLDLKFDHGDFNLVKFTKPGSYSFICVYHKGMKGEVRVGGSSVVGTAAGIQMAGGGTDWNIASDGIRQPTPVPTNTLDDSLSPARLAAEAAAAAKAKKEGTPAVAWGLVGLVPLGGLMWFEIRRHRRTT